MQSVCLSLTLTRFDWCVNAGRPLSLPREKEHRRHTGSLGHLFRFDWWVLAGERGTSVVWQCQALHATAALVGPIVLSAKKSNHFKPKCWCCRPPPFPILGALIVCVAVCPGSSKCKARERAWFSRKVYPPGGIRGSTKIIRMHSTKTRWTNGEQSHTQERKQTRLVPSSSCQTLALI